MLRIASFMKVSRRKILDFSGTLTERNRAGKPRKGLPTRVAGYG
jgi:hypothetical protein